MSVRLPADTVAVQDAIVRGMVTRQRRLMAHRAECATQVPHNLSTDEVWSDYHATVSVAR